MNDALRAVVEAFDPQVPIARAWTPPASWYLDADLYALEGRTVFARGWIAVGRVDQVAAAGDYISGDALGDPWVVVRGEDGALRAFFNVCRHKAACIVSGEGSVEGLVCPYHGWRYGLDGGLQSAPRIAGIEGFDRQAMGLVPIAVEALGPMVFIHRGAPERSLVEEAGPLGERLAATGWDRLHHVGQEIYEVPCNWKVYVDNYLDGGYHVPRMHPTLAAGLDLDSYRTEVFERASIQTSGAPEGEARMGAGPIYGWLYPSFMVNRYGPVLDVNRVVPLGPDRTQVVFDYWFEEVETDTARRFIADSMATSRQVQGEDEDVCGRVQRGLASLSYDRGRYAPRVEQGEHHFHRLLSADYRRPPVARAPA